MIPKHKAVKARKRICELCALFIAAILLVAVGCYAGQWLAARRLKADVSELPKQEMIATDNATKNLKNVIEKAQNERNKLPEVVRGAKDDIRRDVAGLDNNGVAGRWNGLLGRYREDRAAAEGILVEQ
ncbi:hypothetical protein [Cloacibacillus evryensis]|uniref:hypothetical protein n=1 Tax=Cloacibacillus evryensis TaxID=508460 RepID=UPI0004B0FB40|nr:hypothetical protein [Cloacibacillus evryensis]MEA5034051.1 hypothetical protein [Cloacibacillus evryensis]